MTAMSKARYMLLRSAERSKQCAGMALRSVPIVNGGFSTGCLFVLIAMLGVDLAGEQTPEVFLNSAAQKLQF